MAESDLLGVRIVSFDPGKLPKSEDQSRGISKEIRKAEAYYFAIQLKNTMQRSGYWGPVRVVPTGDSGGEVVVTGRILESDGEVLRLSIKVEDARGTHWFTKKYEGVVDEKIYERSKQNRVDAYQFIYSQIANDIAFHRKNLIASQVRSIRQVAEMRFGADLAPTVFKGYLKQAKAEPKKETDAFQNFWNLVHEEKDEARQSSNIQYSVVKLPAKDDPMMMRVRRIRARENLLIDILDQQYDGLSRNISGGYTQWRVARLKEMNAIRELEKARNKKVSEAVAIGILAAILAGAGSRGNCYSCVAAGASIATIAFQHALQTSEQAEAEAKIHKAALEELGQSLASDVEATVIEVEGETIELKGSVEAKFQKWRDVLKNLHERETRPPQKPPGV